MVLFYLTLHRNFRVSLTREEPRDIRWWSRIPTHLHSPSEFILAATFLPRASYRLPHALCAYECTSIKRSLSEHIAAAKPDGALQAAWQLACQGNQEQLLRLVPIVMLSETMLNVVIGARWLWWSIATHVGWVLSEDEWWQACLDVAFLADPEATPIRDYIDPAIPRIPRYPTSITIDEAIPAEIQLGIFCVSLLAQRDPFLYPSAATWLARPPNDPIWLCACADPTEACIVLRGFPRLPEPAGLPTFPTQLHPPPLPLLPPPVCLAPAMQQQQPRYEKDARKRRYKRPTTTELGCLREMNDTYNRVFQ